ncbi:MAG: sulfotransferase [Halobacteriovoraceae bacterium]|nr:sulfotransferase [Halobacteriovoraceae bacterium]
MNNLNKFSAVLPNFIIAGATASGTSFLTHLLLQHKDIFLPEDIKMEPHFFSLGSRYEKGIKSYQKTWFSKWNGQKAIGERSTTYFHFPQAAERLKQHLPQAKFIFVLRNPAERAFAQYRYMVLRGIESLEFKEALVKEKSRLDKETRHYEYIGRSLYGKQLKHFLKFFPPEQILILKSEKLRKNTSAQLKRITDFLEIPPLNKYNIFSLFSSPSIKNPIVQVEAYSHFGKNFKYIIESIRFNKKNLNYYIKTKLDKYHLNNVINNLKDSPEILSDELRAFLEDYFKEDLVDFFSLSKNMADFNDL